MFIVRIFVCLLTKIGSHTCIFPQVSFIFQQPIMHLLPCPHTQFDFMLFNGLTVLRSTDMSFFINDRHVLKYSVSTNSVAMKILELAYLF